MNPILEAFYRDLAGVRDCGLNDLVEELRAFRDVYSRAAKYNQERIAGTTSVIFTHLLGYMKGEDDRKLLR